MAFYETKENNWYLDDTQVENIFINEYLVKAPGDYVKIYIFAKMHARIGDNMTNEMIAMELGLDIEDVLKAWTYWEGKGAVRKIFKDITDKLNYDIEILSLKDSFSKAVPEKPESVSEEKKEDSLFDENMRGLFMAIEQQLGRTITPQEMKAAAGWYNDLGADPEIIIYAYQQAKERGKTSNQYIGGIIRNWLQEGLKSAEDVETYLSETNERRYLYKRIFKALGFFDRNPAEKEKQIMDRWFDEYGFGIDRVLEACGKSSGIANPNINYVNKILSSWHEEAAKNEGTPLEETAKRISGSQILKYYAQIRQDEELAVEERRSEVYLKVPEIKEIEAKLKDLNLEMTRAMIASAGKERDVNIDAIKEEIEALNIEKAFLLTDNNFELDYLNTRYKCDICQDTGITRDGLRCECYKKRAEEAILWQKTQK